jgi:predicted unusual protein kinase regulating ubiquinone biosynthesis (AarF/ABC1/UbiB family)
VSERKQAERRVGFAKLWARAKQIVTTDPSSSDDDDAVVDEEAARVLAAQAGRLKGGLAKVAQLAAYDPGAAVRGRALLGTLWDRAPSVAAGAIEEVVEAELGARPATLFASWDPAPLAAASLGQVHAATLHDGTSVVVKVQYPGVADALRADLDDGAFLRKLAGSQVGRSLDDDALEALADAVRGELDYRAEADALTRFAAAWAGHAVLRFPRVIADRSSGRVLTMTRAPGRTIVETASHASSDVRRVASLAIFELAWGSPLAHRLVNADPNPGNFLVDDSADGVHVWCLDFGCTLTLSDRVHSADLAIWQALLDDDPLSAAERFRMGLAAAGLLRRADSLASASHREWERLLAAPVSTLGDFHWTSAYAHDLAAATGRVLASGGMSLPAPLLLLWRQRLGAASVLGMLDSHAPFRRALVSLVGTGKRALR